MHVEIIICVILSIYALRKTILNYANFIFHEKILVHNICTYLYIRTPLQQNSIAQQLNLNIKGF